MMLSYHLLASAGALFAASRRQTVIFGQPITSVTSSHSSYMSQNLCASRPSWGIAASGFLRCLGISCEQHACVSKRCHSTIQGLLRLVLFEPSAAAFLEDLAQPSEQKKRSPC